MEGMIKLDLTDKQINLLQRALEVYYYRCREDSEFREEIPEVDELELVINTALQKKTKESIDENCALIAGEMPLSQILEKSKKRVEDLGWPSTYEEVELDDEYYQTWNDSQTIKP